MQHAVCDASQTEELPVSGTPNVPCATVRFCRASNFTPQHKLLPPLVRGPRVQSSFEFLTLRPYSPGGCFKVRLVATRAAPALSAPTSSTHAVVHLRYVNYQGYLLRGPLRSPTLSAPQLSVTGICTPAFRHRCSCPQLSTNFHLIHLQGISPASARQWTNPPFS